MNNTKLSEKITEAQSRGLKQITYDDDGVPVTIIIPEATPKNS